MFAIQWQTGSHAQKSVVRLCTVHPFNPRVSAPLVFGLFTHPAPLGSPVLVGVGNPSTARNATNCAQRSLTVPARFTLAEKTCIDTPLVAGFSFFLEQITVGSFSFARKYVYCPKIVRAALLPSKDGDTCRAKFALFVESRHFFPPLVERAKIFWAQRQGVPLTRKDALGKFVRLPPSRLSRELRFSRPTAIGVFFAPQSLGSAHVRRNPFEMFCNIFAPLGHRHVNTLFVVSPALPRRLNCLRPPFSFLARRLFTCLKILHRRRAIFASASENMGCSL